MIILQAKGLSKSFGAETILQDVNFVIKTGEKVGLVGPNGAGKTTLFRCLVGEELADGGEVSKGDKVSLGYLEQIPTYPEGTTLFDSVLESFTDVLQLKKQMEEMETSMAGASSQELEKLLVRYSSLTEEYESAGGYSFENKIRRVVKGLGFSDEDLKREVNYFSGGEKTRVSLAKLLLKEPELLLLDEPTNHLDMEAMEWLEDFLKSYAGAVLVISHDRYFLDQVAKRIIELENGKTLTFNGNYSSYLILKEELVLSQTRAYQKQQAEIQKTEAYIERFRAGIKAKQARGRQSKLNRLERLDAPNVRQSLDFSPKFLAIQPSANIVLEVKDVSKSYQEKNLFNGVNLTLNKGEKVALIGGNGVGKTTLLKILLGKVTPDYGEVKVGSRVKLAYYDQEHQELNPVNRVIDELIHNFGFAEGEARNHLATMLFTGDDVFKRVSDLSGGEKGRLSFLKIFLTGANFLVLDEPTNHLDIDSKEVIEAFLSLYEGTVLFISHDRYFIDSVADKVIELEEATTKEYLGNYTYFKEKKAYLKELAEEENKKAEVATKSLNNEKGNQKAERKLQNEQKANLRKLNKAIQEIEEKIALLEEEFELVGQKLADTETYQDEERAKELVAKYKKLEEYIALAYEEWEMLEGQRS